MPRCTRDMFINKMIGRFWCLYIVALITSMALWNREKFIRYDLGCPGKYFISLRGVQNVHMQVLTCQSILWRTLLMWPASLLWHMIHLSVYCVEWTTNALYTSRNLFTYWVSGFKLIWNRNVVTVWIFMRKKVIHYYKPPNFILGVKRWK